MFFFAESFVEEPISILRDVFFQHRKNTYFVSRPVLLKCLWTFFFFSFLEIITWKNVNLKVILRRTVKTSLSLVWKTAFASNVIFHRPTFLNSLILCEYDIVCSNPSTGRYHGWIEEWNESVWNQNSDGCESSVMIVLIFFLVAHTTYIDSVPSEGKML